MPLNGDEKFVLRSIEQRLKAIKFFAGIGPMLPSKCIEKDLTIAMNLVRQLIKVPYPEPEFPEQEVKSEPECQPTNQNSLLSNSQELPSSAELSSSSEVQ